MKINLLSDIHGEFEGYKFKIPALKSEVDLIILAGDIGNSLFGVEWAIRQSERLKLPIIYIAGNHELYTDNLTWYERAKEYCKNSDVFLLEKDIFEFKGYRFLGCTWWTDYLSHGEVGKWPAITAAKSFMADHKYIDKGHFQPEDALKLHIVSNNWLKDQVGKTTKDIVITHHSPTHLSIGPKYRGDIMSPAFFNDAEGFIIERQPLAWISGHTHFNIDTKIDNTRIISNQRGYKNEGVVGFNPELIIEV